MLTEKKAKRAKLNSLPPSFHFVLPRSADKVKSSLLIKIGICSVTTLLLLTQASKMLRVCSSFPIDTEV